MEAPEYTRIGLKEITPPGDGFHPFALSLALSSGFGEERVLSPLQVFRGHVFLVRGNSPLLAERIGKPAVTVSPEHVLYWHIDARTAFSRTIENGVNVRNIHVKGGQIDDSGSGLGAVLLIGSLTKTRESPIFNTACMTFPSGAGRRTTSAAPKTAL